MKINRRSLLRGVSAAGIASALPVSSLLGCSDDSKVAPAPSPIPTVEKRLHFSLFRDGDHAQLLTANQDGSLELHVGGYKVALEEHTADSLQEIRSVALLQGASTEGITHYASGVRISAVGAQSMRLVYRNAEGLSTLVAGGIHIPTQADALLAQADLEGADSPDVFVSWDDAALYAVFHYPGILAHDPEVAAKIASYVRLAPSYIALRNTIREKFYVTTPEEFEDGDVGWLNASYSLDAQGQKVPMVELDGTPVRDRNGRQVYNYEWTMADDVLAAAGSVVRETTERINSDAEFEGLRYTTVEGTGALRADPSGLTSHDEEPFIFADQGKERSRRTLHVEHHAGTKFEVKLTNRSALGSSMVAGRRNGQGKLEYAGAAYVPATYYPSFTKIFTEPSGGEMVVDLKSADALELYTVSFCPFHEGDIPQADLDDDISLVRMVLATFFLDGVLDMYMPVQFLCMGLGGEPAKELSEELLNHMIKEAGLDALFEVIKVVVIDLFNASLGSFSWATVVENLAEMKNIVTNLVVNVLAKTGLFNLAEILVKAAAISTAEGAIPVFGWAVKAIGVAQTAVQLGIAGHDILVNDFGTHSTLLPAHEVEVVLLPKDAALFPIQAQQCSVTVSRGGSLCQTKTVAVPPGSVSVVVPFNVQIGGTLNISAEVTGGGTTVCHGSISLANSTVIGEKQEVELEMDLVPAPITSTMGFLHRRKLAIQQSGAQAPVRAWVNDGPAPTADDTALSCSSSANKVCTALGLSASLKVGKVSYAFSAPMACEGGGLRTQVHNLSLIGNTPQLTHLDCGNGEPLMMLHSPTEDWHCMVGNLGGGNLANAGLRVWKVSADLDLASFRRNPGTGIAFHGNRLVHARLHPHGYLVALTDVGMEVVSLTQKEGFRAGGSSAFVRRGTRLGQMSGAVAVAPFRDAQQVALLEQGQRRVQILDFAGNPIRTFPGGASALQLRTDSGRTFLDVDIDTGGRIWVLSTRSNGSRAATYTLDIYHGTEGYLIRSIDGVNAQRFAIDQVNMVYTFNAENAVGPQGYAEPTISLWTPTVQGS